MTQMLTLANLLTRPNRRVQRHEYVRVNTVWSSGLPKNATKCQFIFSDGEAHISALLYLQDNNGKQSSEARNVFAQLQDTTCCFKLTNFQVEIIQPNWWRPIKTQTKQLKLSMSTQDVVRVPGPHLSSSFIKHLPFHFTKLEDIDSCVIGQTIDIIGFVRSAEPVSTRNDGKTSFQVIYLNSSRSTDAKKIGCERELCLFGEFARKMSKTSVFALLNVNVVQRHQRQSGTYKTLQTTRNTVIVKIDRNNVHQIPLEYQNSEMLARLLPVQRNRKNSGTPVSCSSARNSSPEQTSSFSVQSRRALSLQQNNKTPTYSPGHPGYSGSPSVSRPQDPLQLNNFTNTPRSGQDRSPAYGNFSGFTPKPQDFNMSYTPSNYSQKPSSVASVTSPFSSEIYSPASVKRSNSDPDLNVASAKRFHYELPEELSIFPAVDYDFVDNTQALKINMKNSSYHMDLNPALCYHMQSATRGIALIINNYFYPDRPEDDKDRVREGSNKDVEYLSTILEAYKFKVYTHLDVNAEELQSKLDDFKSKAHENMDACIVVILSHGLHGLVEMVDGQFVRLPNDIIYQFDANSFPVMAGKPKLFVVQTCQNIPSVDNISQIFESSAKRLEPSQNVNLENMLVCYAAAPGMESGRDKFLGSHFIYVLAHTLMEHSCDTDFETLLKLVQHRLTRVRRKENNILHCDWQGYHFNKKLYFNPGL